MPEHEQALAEAQRQFDICNACRYCEGYCAVFPAMEERSLFLQADLSYLAHLCHDCRACHQACPYTEPHDFAINIPALMAAERASTYERYARPRWLRKAFAGGPSQVLALTLVMLLAMVALVALISSPAGLIESRHGSFYAVVSHVAMLVPALLLSVFALMVVTLGTILFWRDIHSTQSGRRGGWAAWRQALVEIAGLRWMRGGGGECFFPEELRPSPLRRRLHALVAYGFLAAFAATVSAFIAENGLGYQPPYPLLSVPVLLGLIGGVALVLGCVGLMLQKRHAPSELTTQPMLDLDNAFLLSLLIVGATGLLLLSLRAESVMGALLLIHLASVAALYLTLPYGKFLHAAYRGAAVLMSVGERRA